MCFFEKVHFICQVLSAQETSPLELNRKKKKNNLQISFEVASMLKTMA